MTTEELLRQCRAVLAGYYGWQFDGLVLFGSMARRQADASSDIDLLVLLDGPFDYMIELRRIVDLLYPLQLKADQLISAKPALRQEYDRGTIQLYRNARREGVLLT